jgi:hypothetical protein
MKLSASRIKRLNSINFNWDPKTEEWDKCYSLLKQFCKLNGHCRPSRTYTIKGVKLGIWTHTQRRTKRKLTRDQIHRLEAIDFSWDPRNEKWEEGYAALIKFRKKEGHCRVTRSTIINGLNLGNWVLHQRQKKRHLSPDQVKRLEDMGFSWDPFAEQWEEGYAALVKFRKKEGHCRIKRGTVVNGLNLGSWVLKQRQKMRHLSPDQVKRLEDMGFSWDPFAEQWEEGYAALVKFRMRERHCLVSQQHLEGKFSLGRWVSKQRQKKAGLSADRIKRLESLGFHWKQKKGPKPMIHKRP